MSLPKPCGTIAAYRRHRRHGEVVCDPCEAAHVEHNVKACAERGQRPIRECPFCGAKTRAQWLCIPCKEDNEYGLTEGDWVVKGGIKVWVPWPKWEDVA